MGVVWEWYGKLPKKGVPFLGVPGNSLNNPPFLVVGFRFLGPPMFAGHICFTDMEGSSCEQGKKTRGFSGYIYTTLLCGDCNKPL